MQFETERRKVNQDKACNNALHAPWLCEIMTIRQPHHGRPAIRIVQGACITGLARAHSPCRPVSGELIWQGLPCDVTFVTFGFVGTASRFHLSWMSLISQAFAPASIFGMDRSWFRVPGKPRVAQTQASQRSRPIPKAGGRATAAGR